MSAISVHKENQVAQLVERQTPDPVDSMTQVWTPSGAQEKPVSFFESKMLCWMAVGVPNTLCVDHKNHHTHIKDPVV